MQLADTQLLRNVAADSVARLTQAGAQRTMRQGALLCTADDPDAPIIFVLEGALRAYRSDAEGREQTLIIARAGEVINLPAAFAPDRSAPANVEVWEESATAFLIPSHAFAQIVAHDPALANAVMSALASLARHLTELVADLSLRSVRQRLARFLLEQAQAETAARWTHAEIATRLGTAREVVSRQLRALVEEGVIRQERQRLAIADQALLRLIAEE